MFIGICGGTGSGKTTIARKIVEALTHGTGRFKNATSTRLKLAGIQTSGDTPVQLELTGALSY